MKTTIASIALALPAIAYAGTSKDSSIVQNPPAENDASGFTLERLGIVSADAHQSLRDTKFFINGRLRYEHAEIDGLDSADALTLRNRFGIETGKLGGFSFLAEGENTVQLAGTYAAFPGFNDGRSVIADPDNIQLNRLQVQFADEAFGSITVGRQAINLNDQRFVGAVAWRQNDQTFDAAAITIDAIDHLTFHYAYINQVNRIFGTDTPARALGEYDSDSHLINASTDMIPGVDLTAFAYLLDFGNAPAASTNTYGIDYRSSSPVELGATKLGYLLSTAYQTDAANNQKNYEAWYFRAEANADFGPVKAGLGGELLGSDKGNGSFQMPLGTNHKFNGYADAFLITPASGLRDYYASIGATDPLNMNHTVIFHYFQNDQTGDHIGNEINYVVSKKINDHLSVTTMVAYLDGSSAQSDIFRGSIQLDYNF